MGLDDFVVRFFSIAEKIGEVVPWFLVGLWVAWLEIPPIWIVIILLAVIAGILLDRERPQ